MIRIAVTLFAIYILSSCMHTIHPVKSTGNEPVKKEKIYIAPIINLAKFDSLQEWPTESRHENSLLKKIADIRSIQLATFKKSDCVNKYSIVRSDEQHDYRLSITLKSVLINSNSITIPLLVEIEEIKSGSIKSFNMLSSGTYTRSDITQKNVILDSLFANYQKSFPYSTITGYLCSN